jgi:hypothetical protein
MYANGPCHNMNVEGGGREGGASVCNRSSVCLFAPSLRPLCDAYRLMIMRYMTLYIIYVLVTSFTVLFHGRNVPAITWAIIKLESIVKCIVLLHVPTGMYITDN